MIPCNSSQGIGKGDREGKEDSLGHIQEQTASATHWGSYHIRGSRVLYTTYLRVVPCEGYRSTNSRVTMFEGRSWECSFQTPWTSLCVDRAAICGGQRKSLDRESKKLAAGSHPICKGTLGQRGFGWDIPSATASPKFPISFSLLYVMPIAFNSICMYIFYLFISFTCLLYEAWIFVSFAHCHIPQHLIQWLGHEQK